MNTIESWESLAWLNAEFCLRLTQALLHFLWQGCAVAFIYFAFDVLRPKVAARSKYVVAVAALVLMAACLPATMAILPASEATALTPPAAIVSRDAVDPVGQPEISPSQRPVSPNLVEKTQVTRHSAQASTRASAPEASVAYLLTSVSPYATAFYLCGAALMLLRASAGLWGGQRLRRAATLCHDPAILQLVAQQSRRLRLRFVPKVAWCARLASPVVVGVLQPIILLPPALSAGLTNQQLAAVLLHELAHIRRYDLAINLLQRLIEAALFFHPAVWWLSRRVSIERENACDDLALAADGSKLQYADALVRAAELCEAAANHNIQPAAALAATGGNPSQFKRRVLRLMGTTDRPPLRLSTTGLIVSLALVVVLIVAPMAWHGMAKAENEDAKATPSNPLAEQKGKTPETSEKSKPKAKPKHKENTAPISIFGRAMNADSKPIAGAKIYVASQEPGYKRLAETTTDLEGRYEFIDLPLPIKTPDLGQGKTHGGFEVFGQAQGYGFVWRHTMRFYPDDKPGEVPGQDEQRNFDYSDQIHINLTFKPAARLRGQIVDNFGQPIPNTVVDIRQADGIPVEGYGRKQEFRNLTPGDEFDSLNERTSVPAEIKIRKTDADGRFEFDSLPPNCRFRIDVRPPGFAQRWIYAVTQKGVENTDGILVNTDGMELVFARTVDVPVQALFDDSNLPAEKVMVSGGNQDSSDWKTTGAEGRAKLRLPPGEYRFQLLPAKGTPYLVTNFENAMKVVDKTPAEAIVLRLRPAAIVEMTIVDAETDKGLANVDYWVADQASPQNRNGDHYFRSWEVATRIAHVERPITNAGGKIRALFEPGKYVVGIESRSVPNGYEIVEPDGQKLECEAGKTLQLEFRLQPKTPAAKANPESEKLGNNEGANVVAAAPADDAADKGEESKANKSPPAKGGVDRDAILEEIKKLGGRCNVESTADGGERFRCAVRGSKVDDAFIERLKQLGNLELLSLSDVAISDEGMKHIGEMKSLTNLQIKSKHITDAGLKPLEGLNELELLNIDTSKVTDAGLVHLQKLPKLKDLLIWSDQISDEGLRQLLSIEPLREIQIFGEGISDDGLRYLEGNKKLSSITLTSTRITDEGLLHLKGAGNLVGISLDSPRITDAGLATIGEMTQLKRLSLDDAPITDVGLKHLKGLKQITGLYLKNTQATGEGLMHLGLLQQLTQLTLTGARMNNSGFAELPRFPKLTHLCIGSGTRSKQKSLITDEALRGVGVAKGLWSVELVKTSITDAGLLHLNTTALPNLQVVAFSRSPNLTEAGVAKLKAAMPKVSIQCYDPEPKAAEAINKEAKKNRGAAIDRQVAENPKLRVIATVVDDISDKPIEKFRILTSFSERPSKTHTWQSQYLQHGQDGVFTWEEDRPWPITLLRIEADGYRPFVTRPIRVEEKEVKFEIRLVPDADMKGKVIAPDGTAVSGAQVAICTQTKAVNVSQGQLRYTNHGDKLGKIVLSNDDGSFFVPAEIDPWVLVIAHEKGYAEVLSDEFAKSSEVRLRRWGRLEGEYVAGGKPIANQYINIGAGRGDINVDLHYGDSAVTDAAGKFVAERVPPVKLYVHPMFKSSDGSSISLGWFSGEMTIKSGEPTHVKLPRAGRPLVGRIKPPAGSELKLSDFDVELTVYLRPPSVSGFEDQVQKSFKVYGEFMASDIGKEFKRTNIDVNEEGEFRVEGLPETIYVVSVSAKQKNTLVPQGAQPKSAFVAKRVTVPPWDESLPEAIDVGEVILRLSEENKPAPAESPAK